VIGSLALYILVWMNRYSYQQQGHLRINRFTGQACFLQKDGTWNSNIVAPPGWLDTYMRHPNFEATRANYDPNTRTISQVQGISGDKVGEIIPRKEAERQARAYVLNTCEDPEPVN
jgi:hypothetical protein